MRDMLKGCRAQAVVRLHVRTGICAQPQELSAKPELEHFIFPSSHLFPEPPQEKLNAWPSCLSIEQHFPFGSQRNTYSAGDSEHLNSIVPRPLASVWPDPSFFSDDVENLSVHQRKDSNLLISKRFGLMIKLEGGSARLRLISPTVLRLIATACRNH